MFYFAVLVRVVKVLFFVQLRGGVALRIDDDTLVEAVHVNAITSQHRKRSILVVGHFYGQSLFVQSTNKQYIQLVICIALVSELLYINY